MGFIKEYIDKKISAADLESELLKLISEYNRLRKTFLMVYASSLSKSVPEIALLQEDYYIINDLIRDSASRTADFYIETPGGSGEAAEEIVRLLHDKFDPVTFVVSGEAKSAGTIMVLSGNEIIMTETGSLGPIDAQVKIGRSQVSAHDYLEWVEAKRQDAEKLDRLNPFDATVVAQISPGELAGVLHSYKFAEDLVVEWLPKYKFGKWKVTETRRNKVTQKMKRERAGEIAAALMNHSKWRSHGRSIKINDLLDIGLKIIKADEDKKLADLIYRIQTICRMLFETTNIYKIFATENEKIFKLATQAQNVKSTLPQNIGAADVLEIEQICPKCGKKHSVYAKFKSDPKIDSDFKNRGCLPFPKNNKLKCDCGFEIDFSGIRNQVEVAMGRKIIGD